MLEQMQKLISMSELVADPEKIARDIETAGTVYRIKRPGRSRLLLVDKKYIKRLEATIEFETLHPNWREEFAQSDRDLALGLCRTLDEILKERGLEPRPLQPARRRRARRRTRGGVAEARDRDPRSGTGPAKRTPAGRR
jgi:hypothetical protein